MFDLRLDEDIFEIVKNGKKRVEVRLYDEKRKLMKIGDKLTFYKRPLLEEFTKEAFINLLERFYSKEEQKEYGLIAIEFEVI